MGQTHVEQFVADPEGMRLFQQERAIYEITGLIEDRLQEQGVSRSEFAKRLGKTKGWVSQVLDGESNKTIKTVSDMLTALGRALHFHDGPIEITNSKGPDLKILPCSVSWSQDERKWGNVRLTPPEVKVG